MGKRKAKQDKCYYCGSTEELGVETATKRTKCLECVSKDWWAQLKENRRIYELEGKSYDY